MCVCVCVCVCVMLLLKLVVYMVALIVHLGMAGWREGNWKSLGAFQLSFHLSTHMTSM